jgi:hypothetical protein
MIADRIGDLMRLPQGLSIGEPYDDPPQRFDVQLAIMVVQHYLVPLMDRAIQFDDQPQRLAGEVRIVAINRMLPTELEPIAPPAAQQRPGTPFRQTGRLSQRPRPIRSLLSRHGCGPISRREKAAERLR